MIYLREFEVINNVLFKYGGHSKDVIIPENITEIKKGAFTGCDFIESVTLPDSVLAIREYAFADCHNLKTVNIPKSVYSIGTGAFKNCKSIKMLKIPRSVEYIGICAFDGCDALTLFSYKNTTAEQFALKYDLPFVAEDEEYLAAGFEIVDGELVKYHGNDYSVIIPDAVHSIGDSAFICNYAIRSVTIPDTVTHIGYRAFAACTNLKEVKIPDSVETVSNMAFASCKALKSVEIPASVKSICFCAFSYCSTLSSVTFHGSDVKLAMSVFDNCGALTLCAENGSTAHAYALANKIPFVTPHAKRDGGLDSGESDGDFEYVDEFEITDGRLVAYNGDNVDIVIPDTVTYIEKYAFVNVSQVRSITFHAGVTFIESGALNVFSPKTLEIYAAPGSYADIFAKRWKRGESTDNLQGENRNTSCAKTEKITPDEIKTETHTESKTATPTGTKTEEKKTGGIFGNANVTRTTNPDGSISIVIQGDLDMTKGCTVVDGVLTEYVGAPDSVTIPGRVKKITSAAFRNFEDLGNIIIHPGVTEIEDGLLERFESVTFVCPRDSYAEAYAKEKGIKSINAFSGKENGFEIRMGEAVAYEGDLDNVTVPRSVRRIGYVSGLIGVKKIYIPDTVRYIDGWTFIRANSLVILTEKGSYADEFALENGINVSFV